MTQLNFTANIQNANTWLIIQIPKIEDEKLGSRGMVIVEGTLNKEMIRTELEPDGMGGHWFKVSESLAEDLKLKSGDEVQLMLTPLENWYEPTLPLDFEQALKQEGLIPFWSSITPKAKWEWIRWIQFTNNPATRQKRIEVSCSKLHSGKKRPCCFDQSRCTVMAVSKNGILKL